MEQMSSGLSAQRDINPVSLCQTLMSCYMCYKNWEKLMGFSHNIYSVPRCPMEVHFSDGPKQKYHPWKFEERRKKKMLSIIQPAIGMDFMNSEQIKHLVCFKLHSNLFSSIPISSTRFYKHIWHQFTINAMTKHFIPFVFIKCHS